MLDVKDIQLFSDERIDEIPGGAKLIQSDECFSYGIDAVLLARFSKVKRNAKCLDLGTGNGIIPVLMSSVYKNNEFHGIEIQEKPYSMAIRSAIINEIDQRIFFHKCDVKNPWEDISKNSFMTVTTNPPYMLKGTGNIHNTDEKAIARHEILASLDDFCSTASLALNSGGSFYIIHRANRLNDLVSCLIKNSLHPKNYVFIHPSSNKCATMVMIESTKGGNAACNVLRPVIVYDELGNYTEQINEIYKGNYNFL